MCRERAWSGSFSVCFSPPSLPYQPGGSSVSSVGPGGGLGLGRVLSPGLSTSISVFSHVIDSVAMHPGDAHLSLSVPLVIDCSPQSFQFLSFFRNFLVVKSCPTLQLHGLQQASLSFPVSQNLLKLMSIESVVPSNHLILCNSLLLCPQSLNIRVSSIQ